MRLDRLLPSLLPLLVGAVALGLTGWLWRHEQVTTQRALKADFDFSVRQTASRIEQRIASYEQMLRGVQGLCQASGRLDREAFAHYVDALLAGADFVGIQLFGYARLQPGSGGVALATVAHVAPATGMNRKAVGEELDAEPVRRAALQLAADSGGLAITPRFAGVPGSERDKQSGFLMVLPVYAQGKAVDSVVARRAAIAGYVFASVRMGDLMSSLYGEGVPGIAIRVHDGVDVNRQTLMYESTPNRVDAAPDRFAAQEYIGFAGHSWTLDVSARPDFDPHHGGEAAQIIAASGIGFSLLLALLTRQLITGRQRARNLAMSMTGELRASEERYRRIVETADEGILLTNARARTSFVNPKMACMLGYRVDEMLGRPLEDFLEEARTTAAPGRVEGGAPDRPPPREFRFRRKDGSALWASMATTTIVDPAGQPAGSLAMVTDITESKQAEARRIELESQLRESQKMQAIGTLAGGIAHDFNNILAAILGNVALAQQPGLDAATRGSLEQISTSAARARSLVQQILAFSRRQPHSLLSQPLRPVVEESVRLLRPILPAMVELDVTLADAPLNVAADATQLHQVVMNLCTNAWQAMNNQAGRINVGLDAVSLDTEAAKRLGLQAGRHAHLWVSDTGCGMDEATRARIFEPFFTTKPVGRGTGLGLSVVHGIVATHGGAITVASAPGQGSRFDLYFALLAPHDASALSVPSAPSSTHAPPARLAPGSRVLYLDDDPVMVTMVQGLLQRSGYRVTCFEDPQLAMVTLRAQPDAFDIVVTDHNMPGLSGLDVAGEIARLRPGLPVVISSGYLSEEMLAAATRSGVRSVMQKEFTLEQLPEILFRLLAPQPVEVD
jgi:PAS domain S-box-containing protein